MWLQILHPVADILQVVSLASPYPGPRPHTELPAVHLVSEETVQGVSGSSTVRRLHLELRLPAAGAFGTMNISAPLRDWSFPKEALEVSAIEYMHPRVYSGPVVWICMLLHAQADRRRMVPMKLQGNLHLQMCTLVALTSPLIVPMNHVSGDDDLQLDIVHGGPCLRENTSCSIAGAETIMRAPN